MSLDAKRKRDSLQCLGLERGGRDEHETAVVMKKFQPLFFGKMWAVRCVSLRGSGWRHLCEHIVNNEIMLVTCKCDSLPMYRRAMKRYVGL